MAKFFAGISLKANKTNARSLNYLNFKLSYYFAENSLESELEVNWLRIRQQNTAKLIYKEILGKF